MLVNITSVNFRVDRHQILGGRYVLEQHTLQKSLDHCCKVWSVRIVQVCRAVYLYIFYLLQNTFCVCVGVCVCQSLFLGQISCILGDNHVFPINPLMMKLKVNYHQRLILCYTVNTLHVRYKHRSLSAVWRTKPLLVLRSTGITEAHTVEYRVYFNVCQVTTGP